MNKVKDLPDIRKDGGAIVSVDTDAYQAARARANARKQAEARINKIEEDLEFMKKSMQELLNNVKTLVGKV